ncbi:MAG: hypothetical protein RL490_2799, partial [Pseudomonadota bacterium]
MHNITALVLLASAAPAIAQTTPAPAPAPTATPPSAGIAATGSRASENAVRQAGDAFGTSIGREVTGLYSRDRVRGFSPTIAGNIRIDGLYFDPVAPPSSRLARATIVRVGLSALGNPFPAPTGLVDFGFRRPGDSAAASLLIGYNSWGTPTAELDMTVPVSRRLSLGLGAAVQLEDGFNRTRDHKLEGSIIARWQPVDSLVLLPFLSVAPTLLDDHGPTFVPAGDVLPPRVPRRIFYGPRWARGSDTEINAGLLADWQVAPGWQLRAGLFRSQRNVRDGFANLIRNLGPDGAGRQILIADPPLDAGSTSGELRLTRQLREGPRRHQLHLALRGRASDRSFDGSTTIDLGPASIYVPQTAPKPALAFGARQRDRIRQWTLGLAYDGSWADVGDVSAGIQRSQYHKRIGLPATAPVTTDATPLLWNLTIAAHLSSRLVVYAGGVTGLEESGVAPPNAANRNEALPAIRTRQFDAGLRYALTDDVKLVAGVFEVSKPYYNLDAGNRFTELGEVINRGVEASVAGPVTKRLSLVAGGVLLWPRVTGAAVALGRVGPRPVGAIG